MKINYSTLTGKQFEEIFENLLIVAGIQYKREGERVRRGGKIGVGKYDFDLPNHAIELKVKQNLNNLSLPGINRKRMTEILYPDVKGFQVRALRESGKIGGLLICETSTERIFWVTMAVYEDIVIKHRPRTLNGLIDDCVVDLEEFVETLKGE